MLLAVILVEIATAAPDAISIATVIAFGLSLLLLIAAELWLSQQRRAATADWVRSASGLSLSGREAGLFMRAVEAISTHNQGRDVREPPSATEVPVSRHPGTRLRLEFRPAPQYYAAVIIDSNA